MKNIEAGVSTVLTQEKKSVAEGEIEEEECHQMRNEMVFFLQKRTKKLKFPDIA